MPAQSSDDLSDDCLIDLLVHLSLQMPWTCKLHCSEKEVARGAIEMSDAATPNLPSRDFEETSRFYTALGFSESWRDEGWMILKRGDLTLEFSLILNRIP
jgi:hypothetical protein